jgi:ABC-type branched-subunit amino acid transport system substrate-binding protein
MEAYFTWVSDEHPEYFGGRRIRMEILDDAYEPARTVTNIQQLVEREGMFMTAGNLGTPNNLAVYDYLNEQCVPHLWAVSGHPAFGDPENHPWSTPSFLSYVTEGSLWGQYISEQIAAGELEAPASIAVLLLNSDVGNAWLLGFEKYVEEHSDEMEIVEMQRYEVTAPNLTNEMTTVAASDADVFISATAAVACTQSVQEMARSSWDPQVKIIGSVCAPLSFWDPVGQDAGEGWILTQDRKEIADARYDDDPFVVEMREVFDEYGADWQSNSFVGWALQFAIPTVEALKIANDMPGGINRTNVMTAAWSLDFEHPWLKDNGNWTLNGLEDPYPVEQAQFAEYVIEEGEDIGTWVPFGDVIGENGTTPPCAWDGQSCG